MTMYRLIQLGTILCLCIVVTGQNGCYFAYSDFPDKEPVLLYSNYSLVEPTGSGLSLNYNEEILLICPGNSKSRNSFLNFPENPILVKCSDSNKLNVKGSTYSFSQFSCTKSVTGDVLVSGISTRPGEFVKLIGYSVTNGKWDTLFHVVYDEVRGEAVYAEHTLYGDSIAGAKKESSRPDFKLSGVSSGLAADIAYKQATQRTTFTNILGSSELAAKYFNTGSYLARGHLAPDGDFVYVSSQWTTYFYINTVPQWQAINNGNWKSMEGAIRDASSKMDAKLSIMTGGFNVLTLPDINGNNQEIYLASNQQLPVPKFVWKVVYRPDTKEGICFVSVNNPFEEPTHADRLCENICETYGWGSASWGDYTKGLLYCCDVNDMKQVITSIPDLDVRAVLTYNIRK